MTNDFLFELGTEEIPASMIPPARRDLGQSLERTLDDWGVSFDRPLQLYDSPRRLAVLVTGLPSSQPQRSETVTGPPQSRGFDENGNPTPAALGFARKLGVEVTELRVVDTDRGPYLGYDRTIEGRSVKGLLGEALSKDLVASIHWPKTMYWTQSRFRFVRPIRWLVAMWNDEVIEIEIEGVRAGRTSRGHRFLQSEPVRFSTARDYVASLHESFVLVRYEERRRRIEKGISAALSAPLSCHPDPGLLEEVAYLNEFPTVLCGSFDSKYLSIPREILVTVMRHHQKYFWVKDDQGRIAPRFLTVINNRGDEDGRIVHGHEKVLAARLEDAAFFWEVDRRRPLETSREELKKVLFQEELGSYWDKSERMAKLCARLAADWEPEKRSRLVDAARLCKADLTTDMVGELPELQGVMGGLYAREEGLDEEVWEAVYQHYLPVSLDDEVPASIAGAALSVADRLDTITACFGIGIVPTGSKDPFALRRQAQGLIKILKEWGSRLGLDIDLGEMVRIALSLQDGALPQAGDGKASSEKQVLQEIQDFLGRRVRHIFEREGVAYDVLNAVLAVDVDRVDVAFAKAKALGEIRGEPDFEALAVAFKRMRNILSKSSGGAVRRELLVESAEQALYRSFQEVEPRAQSLFAEGRFVEALREIARLRAPVDLFFDEVLVMAEEEDLKANRLALLEEMSRLFLRVGDISEIVQA